MYGVIHVKYYFEPTEVVDDAKWTVWFVGDTGWDGAFSQVLETGEAIDWEAAYAAFEANPNVFPFTMNNVEGWDFNDGFSFEGATPQVIVSDLALQGHHEAKHAFRVFPKPILVEEVEQLYTINFPNMEGVTIRYHGLGYGWQDVQGSFNDTHTFELPEEHKAGLTSFQVHKGGSNVTVQTAEGVYVYDIPVTRIGVIGLASVCDVGIAQHDWVYRPAPATVGVPNVFYVFDNITAEQTYFVSLSKAGHHATTRIPIVPTAAADLASWGFEYHAFFGPSYFYQVTVPAGFTNVTMSSNDWIIRAANAQNAGDVFELMADPLNIQSGIMSFTFNGGNYSVVFKLDGTCPFSLVTQAVTIVQTNWGGSYNFPPTNLFGANIDPTAWNYEVISRPDTDGGAAPQVNTGPINTGLFVFAPQAAPPAETRAGVYVIVATEKEGPGFKVFTVTVQ
jgi:hypothetical protein